jgi:hypothetical protein
VFSLPAQASITARITASPNPARALQNVRFDGSGSSDTDPSNFIVAHDWDFDASDGVDFTSPDASGISVLTSFDPIVIADPGGPYFHNFASGGPLSLDASGSTASSNFETSLRVTNDKGSVDINSVVIRVFDSIDLFQWDLDNDGRYDFSLTDSVLAVSPAQIATLPFDVTLQVKLRVVTSTGLVGSAVTSLRVDSGSIVGSAPEFHSIIIWSVLGGIVTFGASRIVCRRPD